MEQAKRDQAITRLMRQEGSRIFRLCYVHLRDHHLAEDALQETFLKAHRAYDSFRGDSSDITWLSRIAINVCKDVLKSAWFRRVNRALSLDQLPEPSVPTQEGDDTLILAVMALPQKLREVVLLVFYTGLSHREAASALSVSLPTVYRRLEKAQALLKDALEGWYEG